MSSSLNCRVCNNKANWVFTTLVLEKYDVKYYRCEHCYFVQTETPFWIEEAYKNALNLSDTGIMVRNLKFQKRLTPILFFIFGKQNKYLDYAGGYGIFTRIMRDVGFDFYWLDKYATNLISRGFEHKEENKYSAISAFEVFEHLVDPIAEIEEMLKYSDTIIFSTQLIKDDLPDLNWWYYGFSHGQHVALYHKKTLLYLAKKFNLNLASNNEDLHILSSKNISSMKFNFFYKSAKYNLFSFLKLFLKSKTNSDSLYLLQK